MKSKISFFNKTIFWKNVTLYWPIWGIYTLASFISQPILLWIFNNMNYWNEGGGYQDEAQMRDLIDLLGFMPYVIIIAIGAVITGMALYSYMYNSKSANMIHSLPVDRTQLYGTNLISGWAFLIVPLFATAVFTTILCIVYTIPGIGYVWMWFLVVAATAFVAFSIVTICALFTGHIVVLPMYVAVVNFLSWILYWLVYIVVTTFGYGVSSLGGIADEVARFFCPIQSFYENLGWEYEYTEMRAIKDITFQGTGTVVFYMILAVILYIAAYVVYRKRKIEQAGDFLTVNWVKPIFRGAVGIIGGIFGAMVIREVLLETRIGCTVPAFVVIMLVIGAICYFAADMFIKKSFHVFKKKDWLRCGVFSIVLLVSYFGLYGVAEQYENYIPKESEIKSATIHLDYEMTFEDEKISEVIDIHEGILDELDLIERMIEGGNRYYDSVRISYQMSDGEYITRRYMLPTGINSLNPVINQILVLESDEETFLKNLLCKNYEEAKIFTGGRLEAPFFEDEKRFNEDGSPNTEYDNRDLDPVQAQALYDAVIADVYAGTLQKYNMDQKMYAEIYDVTGADIDYKSSDACLVIYFRNPEDDHVKEVVREDGSVTYVNTSVYDSSYYPEDVHIMEAYISIGSDCKNIINALIECNLISSADDIWWGEEDVVFNTDSDMVQ